MSKGRQRQASQPKQVDAERRHFLKALGVTAAAAAVSGEAAADSAQAAEKPKPKGYHETQHIRDYYESARI